MEDEIMMAEKIGQLTQQLEDERKRSNRYREGLWWERWWHSVGAVAILCFILLVAGYPLYMYINSDPTPTRCLIEHSTNGLYYVRGVIPWDTDRTFGYYCSIEDAKAAAEEMGCIVRDHR